eukprot:6091720-Prorocentrum_lima.AAC.1
MTLPEKVKSLHRIRTKALIIHYGGKRTNLNRVNGSPEGSKSRPLMLRGGFGDRRRKSENPGGL